MRKTQIVSPGPKLHLKIGVGVLIMGVLVAVILVGSLPSKSGVEMGFVRYARDGPAVLRLTNHEPVALRCSSPNAILFSDVPPRPLLQSIILMPGSHTQLLASPYSVLWPKGPTNVSLLCLPQSSKLRKHIEFLLSKAGINTVSTGFVVSVEFPPR